MNCRKFSLKKDYNDISDWYLLRRSPPVPKEALPKTGFIVENDNKKICACWLYKTDSNVCLIETLISDPRAKSEERNEAINLVVNNLVDNAKKDGYKIILITSKHNNVIKRAKSLFNFEELQDFKVLARSL